MRARILSAVALMIAAAPFCRAWATDSHFLSLERGPLPDARPPAVRAIELPNGMACYLLSDTTLPTVRVRVITRTGGIYDPADKAGLASLAGAHMRTGGAGELTPEEFDKRLDDMGAELAVFTSREMSAATLGVLSSDLEEGLSLMFEMLFRPRLDEARLATARKAMEEGLRREDDAPDGQADRLFREMVYGKTSPWARRPDKKSLRRIRRSDVEDFHRRYFRADNMILAASGDFSCGRMEGLLKGLTAQAPRGRPELPAVEPVALKFEGRTEQVNRPTAQAFVRMGHLSLKRDNPDKFPLFLVDSILGGGGFKSRLVEQIRVRKGLAYSVSSSVTAERDYGTFLISLDTRAPDAQEAIALVKEQVKRLAEEGDFTKEEIDFAKRSMISRLVFLFDQPFNVVDQRARYRYFGYPDDYWRVYRDAIVRADRGELRRVARDYLHPEGMSLVVVGPREARRGKAKRDDS
ncbi:MAG: insulinase family protein [Proteobacteria bacterium]|nr:insulinase family protein [Pseudomonadota bacterium]